MTLASIIIEPAAKQDILEARDYYTSKGELASEHFRDELSRIFKLLAQHPEAVAVAFGRTRLKPMRRFPYVIGYIFHEREVHVTGVLHGGMGWDIFQFRQWK